MLPPHAQYSAAELAWLHTLDGYADPAPSAPEPSRAERLQRRKVKNRASASDSRARSKARQAILAARVCELERAIADLRAQEQLETAENVALAGTASTLPASTLPASTLPIPPGAACTGGDAPRPE